MSKRRFAAASRLVLFIVITTLALLPVTTVMSQADEESLWSALRSGGHIALLRHALAPGIGDPSGFSLGDCNTQRNLSNDGRQQAESLGARFRANGITAAQVYSSQWCRCLETARFLKIGNIEGLRLLNSFFQEPEQRQLRTQALREWLADQNLDKPLVLVTHQVNITALIGVFPNSGEIILVRPSTNNELIFVGRIRAP